MRAEGRLARVVMIIVRTYCDSAQLRRATARHGDRPSLGGPSGILVENLRWCHRAVNSVPLSLTIVLGLAPPPSRYCWRSMICGAADSTTAAMSHPVRLRSWPG